MVSQKSMASNKFTTAFRKKANKLGLILAYALLEWILIALLLINGVFSYLISRFAAFFGLAPPCVLCSRLGVDSLFESCSDGSGGNGESYRRLLCDAHAAEVSRLGYCGAHRRLAHAGNMCEDCLASAPPASRALSWMRRSELGETDLACACCGITLESGFYSSSFFLPRLSLGVLDCAKKGEEGELVHKDMVLTVEEVEDVEPEREDEPLIELFDEKPVIEDDSINVMAQCDEFVSCDERLLPLESIDSVSATVVAVPARLGIEQVAQDDGHLDVTVVAGEHKLVLASDDKRVDAVVDRIIDEELEGFVVSSTVLEEQSDAKMREMEIEVGFADQKASEEDNKLKDVDANCEIPITIETSEEEQEQELVEQAEREREREQEQEQEQEPEPVSMSLDVEGQFTEDFNETTESQGDIEDEAIETTFTSLNQLSLELFETVLPIFDYLSPEHNDVEEERTPETPTHIKGIHDVPKIFESKRKDLGIESVDGSVATVSSETGGCELLTINQLKSALMTARKSLNALYAELDNERNAAAVAADETMAMITRLQEQKAAMQMEAVQYQRLMEEQSEYDQEALQRLNELVVKREKEKQDLEGELGLYRHKIHLYEAKERRIARRKADDHIGSSSGLSSAEDSDDFSPSFDEGDESAHGLNGSNGGIPTDAVLRETARHLVTLDDSLADFEDERLSILEQLKVLEERLFELEDNESDNVKMEEHFLEENHSNDAANGFSNDKDSSAKLYTEGKNASNYKGKRLLPLFDSVSLENGNGVSSKLGAPETDGWPKAVSELSKEQEKLAIAYEVDHVYERLQALEADREFLKRCIKSLNKGSKGLDLLQEILQHLRELRRIEQRARNAEELSTHYLHRYTD